MDVDVLVVGTGASGIGAAIRLRQAGFTDLLVLEKAAEVGGTWRDNTYPGCACDIPSALYSYSFAPNPDWDRVFSAQPEIHDYLRDVTERFGLRPFIRFDTAVLKAVWDGLRWQVETDNGHYSARVLVSGTGPWHEPVVPDLPGLESFQGKVFHSSRWDHDHDLNGKRVAVVGTGASAIQFVPEIQPKVARLHLFQRTAPWVLPKPDHRMPAVERALFRRFPLAQRLYRNAFYGFLELYSNAFRNPRFMRLPQRIGRWHLDRAVRDPELRRVLTPNFVLGCKRVLLSNNYYPALTKPNVEVLPQAIAEVRPNSVVAADGTEREVDTIVFGTGFHFSDPPIADRVVGADGRTLADVWQGSPQAYLGTAVTGFPNLFLLLGPNLGTGHSSAFTIIESQLRYLVDALTTMRERRWHGVEVRAEAQQAFNAQVQRALATTVYNAGGCLSYYIDQNGRNSTIWPWSTVRMTKRIKDFDPASYVVTSG
jgi:cyclohexanone monooxygenase